MAAPLVVVGLDAASASLLGDLSREGRMPALQAVADRGVTAGLETCLHTLPGAVWPELTTGVSGGHLGLFYHSWQLHTGEAYGRPIEPEDVRVDQYFWNVAARSGREVAMVDAVHAAPDDSSGAWQVFEWGLHDRAFAIESRPPELIDELRAAHGDHPIDSCDRHGDHEQDYRALRAKLLDGARRKADLVVDVLGRRDWELFTCAFAESHCVGHQFWHFADPGHPDHDPQADADLRSTIADVYTAIDEGLGRIVAAAGPDATVVVVASHGMGTPTGGYQLMPEFVARLGLGTGRAPYETPRQIVPRPIRRVLRAVVPERVQQRHQLRAREFEAPDTVALAVKNNRCGAIRLNLRGREPFGVVAPGPEADALLAEITRELCALRHVPGGEPIVEGVWTASEAFGPDHHPDVPDLVVDFRSDLGIIETCESPRVGRIHVPVRDRVLPRTGDHLPESRVWAAGPRVVGSGEVPAGRTIDIAPSVLRALGIDLPNWIEGAPVGWLVPPTG